MSSTRKSGWSGSSRRPTRKRLRPESVTSRWPRRSVLSRSRRLSPPRSLPKAQDRFARNPSPAECRGSSSPVHEQPRGCAGLEERVDSRRSRGGGSVSLGITAPVRLAGDVRLRSVSGSAPRMLHGRFGRASYRELEKQSTSREGRWPEKPATTRHATPGGKRSMRGGLGRNPVRWPRSRRRRAHVACQAIRPRQSPQAAVLQPLSRSRARPQEVRPGVRRPRVVHSKRAKLARHAAR